MGEKKSYLRLKKINVLQKQKLKYPFEIFRFRKYLNKTYFLNIYKKIAYRKYKKYKQSIKLT